MHCILTGFSDLASPCIMLGLHHQFLYNAFMKFCVGIVYRWMSLRFWCCHFIVPVFKLMCLSFIFMQLKRLELKLKQFAEVETILLKECEQVERTRQRLLMERVRMMSTRFTQAGTTLPAAAMNTTAGQPSISASVGQASVSSAFCENLPGHPQMSFIQRPQLSGFGPGSTLSAIHPSPSAPSPNVMFHSGLPNTSNHHLLRSSSGNNSNIG